MNTEFQPDIFERAVMFAMKAHHGMHRKGTDSPYILHPMEAAAAAAMMSTDLEILAAAVLHDTVEDTDVTIEEIRAEFGEHVAKLVAADTENKRDDRPAADTWVERKNDTLEYLRTRANREDKMLILGDKLSNIRSLYKDYLEVGEHVWDRFNMKDPKKQGWYYISFISLLSELDTYPGYLEYCELVEKMFSRYGMEIPADFDALRRKILHLTD